MPLLQEIVGRLDHSGVPDKRFPDAKGEFWALCPFHADHEPRNFSVSERGYNCLACGAHGGLRSLAKHLGIDLRGKVQSKGCTLAEYADAKMLAPALLAKWKVKEATYRNKPEIHMPYYDEQGKLVRIKRRLRMKKEGQGLRFRWLKDIGDGELHLYGLWRMKAVRKAGWVLLVEGESDCHTAWTHDIPCLGAPGANTWKAEWADVVKGLDVYLWKEPDAGGRAFVGTVAKSVPNLKVLCPEFKDISDAHVKGADVAKVISDAKAAAITPQEAMVPQSNATSIEGLAPDILAIFHDAGIQTMRDKNLAIEALLVGWLKRHKRLIVDDGQDQAQGGRPYLVDDDGAIWPIQKDCTPVNLLLYEAGINPTERTHAWLVNALALDAIRQAPHLVLRHWQHWTAKALYVSCGPCKVVRCRDGQLELVANGTDGVWFASESCYPAWQPSPPVHPLTLTAFMAPLEAPVEVPSYTPEVQRGLLAAWIGALLSGLRPLPMLIAQGDKGGGKTTIIRAVIRMLLGSDADLTQLSDDKRDFYTLMTTMPLVGLDNLDTDVPPWLPDALAGGVTGLRYEARKLFTDTGRISRPMGAALAVSTRTAAFIRPDLAERAFPLLTGAFATHERRADTDIMAEVVAQRDGLMSWGATVAEAMLRGAHQAPEGLPLRFIDFAKLAWAYMAIGERAHEAAGMLLALRHSQAVVFEGDPLIEAILNHGEEILNGRSWSGTPVELLRALQKTEADLPYLGGGKRVSRMLREAQSTLDLMGWSLGWTKSGNATKYRLARMEQKSMFSDEQAIFDSD